MAWDWKKALDWNRRVITGPTRYGRDRGVYDDPFPDKDKGGDDTKDIVTDKIDRSKPFNWDDWFKSWGAGGGGGGGSASAGHVVAGKARATHGKASLIDINDPIYSLFAPKPWMSGMLSKGREIGSAQTEDNLRLMRDNATRAGISTSSPSYLYMVSMQRRNQQQALAGALRDANLAWTLPAADRRHGALGANASMLTDVSMGNAGMDTNVSIANAGYATEASKANAANKLGATTANMMAGLERLKISETGWMYRTDFMRNLMNDKWKMAFDLATARGAGGGADVGDLGWDDYGNAGLGGGAAGLRAADEFSNCW